MITCRDRSQKLNQYLTRCQTYVTSISINIDVNHFNERQIHVIIAILVSTLHPIHSNLLLFANSNKFKLKVVINSLESSPVVKPSPDSCQSGVSAPTVESRSELRAELRAERNQNKLGMCWMCSERVLVYSEHNFCQINDCLQ